MENKKLGKLLIAIGVIIAIVPTIIMSAYAYYSFTSYGGLGRIIPYAFLIFGLIIGVIGEIIRRK
jgi:hypothetical protein